MNAVANCSELDVHLIQAAIAGQAELDEVAQETQRRIEKNNLATRQLFKDALPEWALPYLNFSPEFHMDRKAFVVFSGFTIYMCLDGQLTFSWGYWHLQRNDWSYLYTRATFSMAVAKAMAEGGPRSLEELFPNAPF